jgi:undecaprenyl phosphate-alpha-L-ara4N flippase subunit ArnF
MAAVVACVTIADLLLKRGASSQAASAEWLNILGVGALASPYTIIGIVFHLLGLAAWLKTLRVVPLTIAYCVTAIQQGTIAIGAWLWLGEKISPMRWGGISLVLAGVLLVVPTIAAADRATANGGNAA